MANNYWSPRGPRGKSDYPTAYWDCSSRDITQNEIDTPDTLATRLWEYQVNFVNFLYFRFIFVHQEDFCVF